MTRTSRTFVGIPRPIWALGFVSMFMDISSEMIHSLLPVFLVTVLGSSAIYVGLIEGVAEATALITRAFSGTVSDWLGKRKALAVAGYLIGTLTKPLFAMATGVGLVFMARFLDRIGKGVRGAPRDALVADIVHADLRGAAYGLRQSLDTVGALLGPILAILLMVATTGNFRSVFWAAVVPGLLAVSILGFGIKEPSAVHPKPSRSPINVRDIMGLGHAYWLVVAFGSVLTLARFSEAFLLLRAQSVGVTAYMVPIMLALMNLVYALTAYPIGHLSDRIGRTGLLAAGLVVLIASDLILAIANTGWQVAIGSALWGLQMGLTQGLLAAMVADTAHQDLRGTAFGVFSMASGFAMLFASLLAGWLWEAVGAEAAFIAGACFALVTLIAYPVVRRKLDIQMN